MYKLLLVLTFVGIAFGAVPRGIHHNFTIVGGEPTDISNHPWQIAIEDRFHQYCAGFLISDSWALTAAHCYDYPKYVNIRAGTSLLERGGETIQVKKFITHPKYDDESNDNDIGLIKLSKPVTNPNAKPATLPAQGEAVEDNVLVTVIGWGATSENGPGSKQLLQVQIPTISQNTCQKAYKDEDITENMLCAGLLGVGGKDSCQGDSGGPVKLNEKIVGIISWGYGCAEPKYPGVYTKVSNYIDWIKSETGLNL